MTAKKIVVVGAGVSGLAAAVRVLDRAKERGEDVELTVLEASERAGGGLGSEEVDGFVIERGADGFLTEKRAAVDLATRLGIANRLVRTLPQTGGAQVLCDGELQPIPAGFSMMAATELRPILRPPILSAAGKARLAAELLIPKGPLRDDESLASFVRRRFGDEVLTRLAQPLVAGIYGGDPEKLSLRATMPRFLDEEQRSGSVTLGLWKKAQANRDRAGGARYGLFAAFDRGMQVLVDALVAALPPGTIRHSSNVRELSPTARGATLATEAASFEADHVILAANARTQAKLVAPFDRSLGDALSAIEHGSCVTVNLGFSSRVVGSLGGYGVVVPSAERRALMAATFASRKWPNRAKEGRELVRAFLGGSTAGDVTILDDDALLAMARRELAEVCGVTGEPVLHRIVRWRNAMPQYFVGHLDRVRAIDDLVARHRSLRLAGNSLRGVGIPDAIASGQRAADSIFDRP